MADRLISRTATENQITDVWKNENGCIAIVHRPILTEEERARRMKNLERAAARLLMSKREPTQTA